MESSVLVGKESGIVLFGLIIKTIRLDWEIIGEISRERLEHDLHSDIIESSQIGKNKNTGKMLMLMRKEIKCMYVSQHVFIVPTESNFQFKLCLDFDSLFLGADASWKFHFLHITR